MRSIISSCGCFLAVVGIVTGCGHAERDALVAERDKLKGDLSTCQAHGKECDGNLTTANGQNAQMAAKLTSLGQNVEQLIGAKSAAEQQNAALSQEVEELRRLRASAEQRNAEYQKVMARLNKMIDAGTLQVKIRNGRMIVQMSSDVVFPPGGTVIKKEAQDAITELAQTIKEFPDRKFQIVGHSDNQPIHTKQFPSNWELSAARAVEVVKVMIVGGVPAENLSAAGNAEFDPLVANDTVENKTQNRRVEIVFMPKLDELPGFDAGTVNPKASVPAAR
ncbi:MAG: flagellar motor protein MotB [Clostridia bacterium]|nr:flagellar motor protein MotB [Deltaproteobacteria bacterium]